MSGIGDDPFLHWPLEVHARLRGKHCNNMRIRRLGTKTKIYHNPRCSKSRATLQLLEQRGIDVEVIEYLKTPPTKAELEKLLTKLDLEARDIVRTSEDDFKASGLSADADADALLELIASRPKVLQRPIVEHGRQARIGRPPERVLELFE